MEYFEAKDYIMHESRKEDFAWESSVRLTSVGSNEELAMFLEEREGRKRKWQGEGKMMRREEGEEREQRKVPPKKIMGEFIDFSISYAEFFDRFPVLDKHVNLSRKFKKTRKETSNVLVFLVKCYYS